MVNVSIELKNYQDLGEIFIDKMMFLGFKLSNDKNLADVYYILYNSMEEEKYLVKTSFLLDKKNIDKEMAYLNHPLQSLSYIDKFPTLEKEKIQRMIDDIDASNSYYCDFRPIDIINDLYKFNMIHTTLDGKQKVKRLVLRFKDYFRIESIRNKIIFKLPLNPNVDNDPTFFNVLPIKEVKLNILGLTRVETNFILFLQLVIEKCRPTGLFIPVEGLVGKEPIPRENYDNKKFIEYYPDNFMANLDRFYTIYIKDNNGDIVIRMSILRKYPDNKRVSLYIIEDSIENSILLNPYKLIYY